MFWGLIMEPGKKYSQTVEQSFHIAQAALDLDSAQNSPVQVLIGIDGRNYLVCTLIKDKVIQVPLDLNFQVGNKVSFATNGPGHVHLTGYLVPEDDEFLEEYDSEVEVENEEEDLSSSKKRKSKEMNSTPNKKSKTEMLLDQLDEEDYNESDDSNVNLTDLLEEEDASDDESAEDDEDSDEVGDEEDDDDDDDSDEEEASDQEEEVQVQQKKSPKKQESPKQNGIVKKTPKQDKHKDNKSPKGQKSPTHEKSPKNEQQKQKTPKGAKTPGGDSNTPQKKTLEGGVHIEDLKVGEGQVAKPGRNVRVFYEGRLKSNNKVFDSSTKGAGFKFRLGKQEVIKGWDIGLAGMKIGGKRRIVCPPHMAYGASGSPPVIPPNSTLVFEVELKQVM